jgi:GTPase KRas protein
MSSKPCYRVVLLGDGGVGKSAITLQFTTNQFSADYDPTIEDAYRVDTTVDGEDVVLDVLDTAGQEVFSTVREQYMRDGDSFLLVFSLISKPTLISIATIFKQLSRVKGDDSAPTPALVLGNKVSGLSVLLVTGILY